MLSTEEIRRYVQGTETPSEGKLFCFAEAKQLGEALGVHWEKFGVEEFRMGLDIELEHCRRDPATDAAHNEPMIIGQIALAHLNEVPDYYTQRVVTEQELERVNSTLRRGAL